jgi:6-pyruvoyltetrahydropterin/6-carboxytetrahydropterin synthase
MKVSDFNFRYEYSLTLFNSTMRVTISRKAIQFRTSIVSKDWTAEQNNTVLENVITNFHGHNYELIVSVTGKIDPETGFL